MKAEDEAAIYLEECGINGDAVVDIHEDHVDDYEKMKGCIQVAYLMAGFTESQLQALKEEVENIEKEHPLALQHGEDARYIWPKRWKEMKNLITNLKQ